MCRQRSFWASGWPATLENQTTKGTLAIIKILCKDAHGEAEERERDREGGGGNNFDPNQDAT